MKTATYFCNSLCILLTHKRVAALIITLLLTLPFAISQTPTEMPVGKRFHIQSAMNFGKNEGGYWDVPGLPNTIQRGTNIQVWNLDYGHDRIFTLHRSPENGYYEIQIGNTTNSRVDIQGRGTANGTSVKTWDRNGQTNQRFLFYHMGNGRFKIFDRNSGKAFCLAGRKNANGTDIHIWGDHNGDWMEWYLIDIQTKKPFIPSSTSTDSPRGSTSTDIPIVIGNRGSASASSPSVTEGSASSPSNEIRLENGDEMVYGRIGVFDNGDLKYTFSIVRKSNKTKVVFRRRNEPYNSDILSGGGVMNKDENPPEHDLYDYFVIFNGKRFGPYDRILEMHQVESNIDKWISADGKYISFAAQKGDRHFPVVANVEDSYPFRGPHTAPVFDVQSGKNTMILRWSQTDLRLKENGNFRLRGWNTIRELSYSSDGSKLLYIGAEKQEDGVSVFLNHQKIAGSLNAGRAGFIPNTNIHYFLTNNKLTVGSREIELLGVVNDRIWFVGDFMILVPRVSGNFNDMYKQPYYIYEYNHKTDEIKMHESYGGFVRPVYAKGSSTPYYQTFNSNGDALLVKQGGEILQRVTRAQRGDNNVSFAVAKNGDFLVAYKDTKDKLNVLLNGKPFTAVGYSEYNPRTIAFCEQTSMPIIDVTTGRWTDNENKTRFILGDKVVDFDNDPQRLISYHIYRTLESNIFVLKSEPLDGNRAYTRRTILKNNQPLYNEVFLNIANFALSCDGNRHALIANQTRRSFQGYITENNIMHEKWNLVIDGKVVEGNFGAPIWSKKKQKFLALKQEGNAIRIIEL